MRNIIKRDGTSVKFDISKISAAITKAFVHTQEVEMEHLYTTSDKLADEVCDILDRNYQDPVNIEDVQNEVENMLALEGYMKTAKAYIVYRAERTRQREKNSDLMKKLHEIDTSDARKSDTKRDNANVDGNTAMGSMLQFGSEGSKSYNQLYVLDPEASNAHSDGDIHIHDLDFYTRTATCCQIDLSKLFKDGFSTGHGFLREPQAIMSYAALAAIAIQANQNDMHGGQSIANFDRDMAKGVRITFRKSLIRHLEDTVETLANEHIDAKEIIQKVEKDIGEELGMSFCDDPGDTISLIAEELALQCGRNSQFYIPHIVTDFKKSYRDTKKQTFQAMESFIHNMNTMHSRAGAQVPFSSINYGTDTSVEGRLVTHCVLQTTLEGLGKGETPIFPIQIFRLQKGVNAMPEDPNYDLFTLALKCSAKRLFPNFSFQDATFNKQYWKEGKPETEIAYMGCRTRVMGNVHDPEREIAYSRGNLSFTTINLPRLAIESGGDMDIFWNNLDVMLNLVLRQLVHRYKTISTKNPRNMPFLMTQGVWLDSEKLSPNDTIEEVLKHGTLTIGFIGLAETLKSLTNAHHGESKDAQALGLEIVKHMRDFCDKKAQEIKMNVTLIATPAEGLSGRFVKIDKKRFGVIDGVTDKEFYTNSYHVPVEYGISIHDKIDIEAPYHALTNAGHISYVEVDGNLSDNIEAFRQIIYHMLEANCGYGAVNHPIDSDPVCGYHGIIKDICPRCGRKETPEHPFERLRRITGYLVGTLNRFNDAKKAEEASRVKHDGRP